MTLIVCVLCVRVCVCVCVFVQLLQHAAEARYNMGDPSGAKMCFDRAFDLDNQLVAGMDTYARLLVDATAMELTPDEARSGGCVRSSRMHLSAERLKTFVLVCSCRCISVEIVCCRTALFSRRYEPARRLNALALSGVPLVRTHPGWWAPPSAARLPRPAFLWPF